MNRPVNRVADRTAATAGAHSLGERKKKGWLLWLILALLVLAALAIWAIVHNRDDDDGASSNTIVATVPVTVEAASGGSVTGSPTATVTGVVVPAATASTVSAANGGVAAGTATTAVAPASAGSSSSTAAGATTSAGTPTDAGAATTSAATPANAPVASSPAAAGAGAAAATIPPAPGATSPLAANGQDLVAVSSTGGALAGLVDQPAAGQATVQSVISDEGFWVGTDEQNRVFVFLSTEARGSSGESPFQVVQGQTVEIAGTLTSTDGRIPSDVTDADGLQQLTDQHSLVNATSLKLVK